MAQTRYTKQIIGDYCVVDTETTGTSPYYDEIIEIGIVRVRSDEIVDRYSQLVKPSSSIPAFISHLTGITNAMVANQPRIDVVKDQVLEFIGDDVLLGHNTSFDIRFLNAGLNHTLDNPYMDTLPFSKKVFPELERHRLTDLVQHLGLANNEHRALADCIATKELYDAIKSTMVTQGLSIEGLWKSRSGAAVWSNADIIHPEDYRLVEGGYFYDKHVVFTGKLEKAVRTTAMEIVRKIGGIADSKVTKATNFLVLGDNDYNKNLKGTKSSKRLAAEKLKLEGHDIEILDERTFYDLLDEWYRN